MIDGRRQPFWPLALTAAILAAGLLARGVVFQRQHAEGDERIYRGLMEQVREGRGYTLRGLPILENGAFNREIYDQPVFPQHPPGGVLLFLACDFLTPGRGASTAQVVAFALFCAGTLMMWRAVDPGGGPAGMLLVAAACAFSPIAAHVTTRQWLDGPLLGFAALGAGFYLLGVRGHRPGLAAVGCVLLWFACGIKLTAIGVLPWLFVLSLAVATGSDGRRFAWRCAPLLLLSALAAVVPWLAWLATNEMSTAAATRPNAELMRTNRFIRFVTIDRSPLIYLTLTPFVLWTLLPSTVMTFMLARARRLGAARAALALWVVATLITYVLLGFLGYSRLLRYAILVTPAAIALFASLTESMLRNERSGGPWARRGALAFAFAGLTLEVAQGVHVTFFARLHMIVSIVFPAMETLLRAVLGGR